MYSQKYQGILKYGGEIGPVKVRTYVRKYVHANIPITLCTNVGTVLIVRK